MVMFGEIKDNGPSLIEERLDNLEPDTVIEFGTGRYSDVLGLWTERNDAILYSYHSDPVSLDRTRIACRKLNSVKALFAPVDYRKRRYKIENIPVGVDFVVIDGPSRNIGKQETLGIIWSSLARNAEVFLMEADHNHEKACLDRWAEEFDMSVEYADDGKIAIITKA